MKNSVPSSGGISRVLMFSHGNVADKLLVRCINYEFEEVIRRIDTVTAIVPSPKKWFKYGTRISQRLAKDTPIALNPGIDEIIVEGRYDLFFTVCEFVKDLLALKALKGWRERCGKAVCWIDEILLSECLHRACLAKLISQFDHVIVGCKQGVDLIKPLIQGECIFSRPGVDAFKFSPFPHRPERGIDVLSIGRRSEVTHRKLIRMAEDNRIMYVFDSTNGTETSSPAEHRLLYANLCKRSRYFIVNPGKIDQPEAIGRELIIGARYFEGAASGCILIGEIPGEEGLRGFFPWPDAVIPLPYNSENVDKVMEEIDLQPDWQKRIRKNNIVGSLLNHDWVYRWEIVLGLAGMEPLPALVRRRQRLSELAESVEARGV
ncbi:MAG: glycosyltransferase [Nitrospira sp.]|nr:glycosyltransferase [Nitrospira sp.]